MLTPTPNRTPPTTNARPGSASTLSLAVAALAALGALYFASPTNTLPTGSKPSKPAAPAVSMKREVSARRMLMDAGLSPEALAAAGVSVQQATSLVSAGRQYLTEHGEASSQALTDLKAATQRVSDLAQLAQSGRATEQQLTDLATARQSETTLRQSVLAARAGLFSAATAGLSDNQKALLQNLAAARAEGWEIPLPFLVTVRSEADRVAIRDALAEVRIAGQEGGGGGGVSQASQDILSRAREDAPTTQAESDLANFGVAVRNAWTEALR